MPTIEDVRGVPCPTCKMPADSCCVEVDNNGEMAGPRVDGVHNTRIHRYQVVTEAIAHNQALEEKQPVTNDIAVPTPQGTVQTYQQSSVDRLQRWAEQAQVVAGIAADIVSTSFAPKAYRGKPAEATAAILAGAELGFDPMASLRAFDDIQGTPAPKAITLRAVTQAAGHQIHVVESTPDRAVVEGRRRGSERWERSEWTIDRARALGLLGKDQWQKQPAAMLVARATSEVCRWIASDAIMGMPYSAEEIADTTGITPGSPTRQVTAADIVGQAVTHTAVAPAPAPGPATPDQLADIRELFDTHQIHESGRRQFVIDTIGRDNITGLGDLTGTEADAVAAAIATRATRGI